MEEVKMEAPPVVEQSEEQKKLAQLGQEYTNFCAQLGQNHYIIKTKEMENAAIYERIKNANNQAFAIQNKQAKVESITPQEADVK